MNIFLFVYMQSKDFSYNDKAYIIQKLNYFIFLYSLYLQEGNAKNGNTKFLTDILENLPKICQVWGKALKITGCVFVLKF